MISILDCSTLRLLSLHGLDRPSPLPAYLPFCAAKRHPSMRFGDIRRVVEAGKGQKRRRYLGSPRTWTSVPDSCNSMEFSHGLCSVSLAVSQP